MDQVEPSPATPLRDEPPVPSRAAPANPPVNVADHELIQLIRSGNYGQVWLARNRLGTYRAVKLVFEDTFRDKRPFQREFNGVQKFEPISRQHEGLVDILQVGRDEQAGCFYYVMELADHVVFGSPVQPADYSPRTLAHDIAVRKRLPVSDCLEIAIAIASALDFLHERGLIHRDVKPSNIVFVNGTAKLADVGLVAETSEARSYVGTEGFIPPEGPGTVRADIFSLGKVLYEMSTGKDRYEYPDLPTNLEDKGEDRALMNLNQIIVAACRSNPRDRYGSAREMIADMEALQQDPACWRPRDSKRRRALTIGVTVGVVVAVSALMLHGFRAGWFQRTFPAPVVESVTPGSGAPGDAITISGANFGSDPSKTLVYFGPARAHVISATSNRMVVSQPLGATYAPVTVSNRGLTGYSPKQFLPTFVRSRAPINSNSFSGPFEAPTKRGSMRVAVADFDGDGKPEIAVAVSYDHLIAIYQIKSPGGILEKGALKLIREIPFGSSRDDPFSVTASDIDGDGRIDLVATQRNKRIGVLRNISSAATLAFAPPVYVSVGTDPRNLAVRDLNQDGLPDLIIPNYFDDSISILQNTSVPGRSRISFGERLVLPVNLEPTDVTAGDLDGDGRPDLAIACGGQEKMTVYRNVHTKGILTTNSFGPRIDFDAPYAAHSIVMADLDGDGKEDLILGTRESNTVAVFHNRATPGVLSTNSFAPAVTFTNGGKVHQVAVGDLNGDGKPDIVVATEQETHLSIFENRSVPGTFTAESLAPRLDLKAGWNCTSVVVADMDLDGGSDLVFCSGYTNAVYIYKNLLR